MFGVVVTVIGRSWRPEDVKLLLVHSVLDPIEAHVDGFGSGLFTGGVGDGHGSGIVDLDRGGGLDVAHFGESGAQWDSFLAIVEEGTDLGFCCEGGDGFDDFCES